MGTANCPFGYESSRPCPELFRRQSAFGPNGRTDVVRTGTAQTAPALLTDCPASRLDSAGHSTAAMGGRANPTVYPCPMTHTCSD